MLWEGNVHIIIDVISLLRGDLDVSADVAFAAAQASWIPEAAIEDKLRTTPFEKVCSNYKVTGFFLCPEKTVD